MLLASGYQACQITQRRRNLALTSRGFGSGSRSPSPDRSGGLLGDVVKQASKGKEKQGSSQSAHLHPSQSSQAHVVVHPTVYAPPGHHSQQSLQGHASQPHVVVHPTVHAPSAHQTQSHPQIGHQSQQFMQGHPSQSHVVVHPTIHAPPAHQSQAHLRPGSQQALLAHPVHPNPSSQVRPAQLGRTRPLGRPRKHPAPPPKPEGDRRTFASSRLGELGVQLRPKPSLRPEPTLDATGSRVKKPRLQPPPGMSYPRKKIGKWWNRAGGRPNLPFGTSPQYELNKTLREERKADKEKAASAKNDHPPGPHGHSPHGPGPGSPGAGSHAVSKRGSHEGAGTAYDAWLPKAH